MESGMGTGLGGLPSSCLMEILKRLSPPELLAAATVCKSWRDTTRRLAKILKIRVPARAQVGIVGSMLQKCPGLVDLSLKMESDVDATLLAWITFSAPSLEFLEIYTAENATNQITGDELSQFVADGGFLKSLKMEGCSNLGGFSLCSSSLCTIWLSGLQSLTEMVFNCPNLEEICLDFSARENDKTDLVTMVDVLGRKCPKLQSIHLASVRLSDAVVFALTAAHFRELRMLSLVRAEITNASVDAISSRYPNLERVDPSGDVDTTLLARVTFSSPNLNFLEISTSEKAINQITGYTHGTTVAFLFLDGGEVLIGLDSRTTSTPQVVSDRYVPLIEEEEDAQDSVEDLNAGVYTGNTLEEDDDIEVVEDEGVIGVYEKHHIFGNKVFAAFAGNCETWEAAVKHVDRMVEVYTEMDVEVSPIMVANKFKLHLKRYCVLRETGLICGDTDIMIVGFDSKEERVRLFTVTTVRNNMILKEYKSYNGDAILGSGRLAIKEHIRLWCNGALDYTEAQILLKGAMLKAALEDQFTGGDIKLFQVTPSVCEQVFQETVLELYHQSFPNIDSCGEEVLVVYKESDKVDRKEVEQRFKELSGWKSDSDEAFVILSHILGYCGDYIVRRFVFKDPTHVGKILQKMKKKMGGKPKLAGVEDMPCTQVPATRYGVYVYAGPGSQDLLGRICELG